MLSELVIRNFAIIDELHVQFGEGFIVFTGETGAGKSIIFDAVEALIGGRVDTSSIRTEAETAYIEGHFLISNHTKKLVELLQEEEIEIDSDLLIISREIRLNGRNIARINGKVAPINLLKRIVKFSLSLHGQSEHLSLLRQSEHLPLLDRFAGTIDLLESYKSVYKKYKDNLQKLKQLELQKNELNKRCDLLNYQLQEIQNAHLKIDEDKELKIERDRLSNAEGIASILQEIIQLLDEGYQETPSIIDLMGQVTHELGKLTRLDSSQNGLLDKADELFEGISELSKSIRSALEEIEFNPKRLSYIEERLSLIYNLQKKYGSTIEDILNYSSKIANELESLQYAEEHENELKEQIHKYLSQLEVLGKELSIKRHKAAETLAQQVRLELNELKMSGADFQVIFKSYLRDDVPDETFDNEFFGEENGFEDIEFFIAPNPGEGLKPLSKTASGGETSRIMLALKNVLANADQIPTLIFDEIDQGIGGRVGSIVGRKIWNLGRKHQVLCITHLPQLAAFGDQHFQVQKIITEGRTKTIVRQLTGEDRILELAQMMGEVSDGTLRSAFELLQSAKNANPL
jgi:DNA repair protein RecN (Recombination protein N)